MPTSAEKFRCMECDVSFNSAGEFDEHAKEFHKNKQDPDPSFV
jgi:hypothetical protein